MQYLVTMEALETGLLPPQQVAQIIENQIIPSLEACGKLCEEKKILAGGVLTGRRAGAVIVEAASNEELNRLLGSLPFWGMMKVDVTPMVSFDEQVEQARQQLEAIKAIR
jgi:muconolactone delta-isomerase